VERKNSSSKSDKRNNRYFRRALKFQRRGSAKPRERNAKYNANPGYRGIDKNVNFCIFFFFYSKLDITIPRA